MDAVQPLGDQAVLASFASEAHALRFAAAVQQASPSWLLDVVQAYTTVAVFYDLLAVSYVDASTWVRALRPGSSTAGAMGRLHEIPCCYDLQLDLERVSKHLKIEAEEVIRLHTSVEYTVYA